MSDYRKKYIIDISGGHLGFTITEDTWEKDVLNINLLEDFLDNETNLLLCASLVEVDLNKRITFLQDISKLESRTVIFYKIKHLALTEENILETLNITSIQGSVNSALYHTLNKVFVPLINKSERKNAASTNINRHLTNLQAGLRSSLLNSDSIDDPISNVDADSLSVVLSIDQEVEYWHNVANNAKSRDHKTSSTSFRDILTPLARDFSVLEALPISDVEDIIESAHNILDDLWRHEPPYPRARTEHLMELIASDVCIYIGNQFKNVNIWHDDYNVSIELLEQCALIGKRWLSSCRELTELFWPNYSLHMWKGSPYVPDTLENLAKRLNDILNIRTVHKQLTRLLSSSEQEDLKTEEMFKPYKEFNILQCGSYTEPSWVSATKQFEYLLQPAEQKVAYKLKSQLSSINANTRQLLHEFSRYSELICRPILKSSLQTERQYLLSSLNEYVRILASDMSETPIISTKYETPQVVAEIIGTRQLEAKATEVQIIASKLLDDLQGYEELKQSYMELLKALKDQHSDLYESWTSEIIAQIKDKSLSLCENDPVVQFSANKLMRVNYSPRLVTLISEVRQLTALGYNIPDVIVQTSTHAKQFMKFAKYLEQISNFHNTIGDRMIPSQRPMMLPSALELSRLVQEQEVISWGDIKSVDKYVNSLKVAVDKLSKENNLLTSYNYQIIEKINLLNNIDLIKYYDKWKQTTREARDIMTQVQLKGFKSMQNWKTDIDKALAIVLESQYAKCLDTVHLYLPEIYAELVYRNSMLLFSPNEETLKEKYEQQMKRFLEIPKSFRGVGENSNAFANIIDGCNEKLLKVTANTDSLFEQLKGVKKHWESWLSLGVLDVSQLVTWQHWDLHFRSSKTFGQEIAKLPSTEERVGCFIIGLSRLRSDLESHNRSYWDQLVATLKDSIVQDVVKLQQYVDTSTATLNRQPLTLEQIGEADASHSDILTQRPEMEKVHQEMVQKVQILASWTRERIDSVNRLQGGWERLENLLENYQHIIAKQVETVKTTLHIASQNLTNEMDRFAAKWEQVKPRPNSGQIAVESLEELNKHLTNIKDKKEQWSKLKEQQDKIINDYTKFNLEVPSFEMCEEIDKDLEKEEIIWTLFEKFYNELDVLNNEEWIVFRKKFFKLDDFLEEWKLKLQNMDNTPLVTRLLQEIHKYQEILKKAKLDARFKQQFSPFKNKATMLLCHDSQAVAAVSTKSQSSSEVTSVLTEPQSYWGLVKIAAATPTLKYLRGDDFTEKHWLEAHALLQIPAKSLDNLTLRDFLSIADRIVDKQIGLQAICKKAASEIIVRQALAELDQWDVQAHFQLSSHNDSRNKEILLIKDFKEILNKIGDNQSLLQSVKNSADYESFLERASVWESRLTDLDIFLTSLAQIQRKWVYLEPIFGSGTLGQEKARFDKLDRDFRHILNFVQTDSRVCSLCRYPNLRSNLDNLLDQLSRCQKSLDDFLTEKRNKFPRFLFLGDDDLLEVVGQSSKEQVIQSHLKKLFAGIHSIQLDDNSQHIIAMNSLQGESVTLSSPVDIKQPVEDWLNNLVKEMQRTLKDYLERCLADGKSPDPLKYPSQILCLADSIHFTNRCEQSIGSMSLSQLLATYKAQLEFYSSLDMNETDDTKNDENDVLELKLKSLLLDTIHHISVIEELIDANVSKVSDWHWQKQLRFYLNSSREIAINMVNARIEYAYEYIGNTQKLVRTQLTDKCFLTLTQGMHLGMGGNPYGPAGTGKTESVKALGALLGRQVLVFNCDEGIDAASMGRILSGLVRCGAWGCFDEFNRLDEATLSAISMHIQPIQNALKTQKSTVSLLDQEIQVNRHCGIFVTLNPAGGGYGGRNKLPDNLKQLFRPVVMTHPDHELIAKTLLHCDGYKHADVIGRKLIEVFSLASKLLSKQQHYDWGLRALRTVLSGCGSSIKERHKKKLDINQIDEFSLVVRAIRIDTLSKLTFSDSDMFDGLVRDVFPGIDFENAGDENVVKAIEESFIELNLEKNDRQINKCIELLEQLRQRMGVAIVGPPSSGKTTIRNILLNALGKMGNVIKQHVFNPKSMTRHQLLGQIDVDTRQWTDGVLTQYSLQVTNESLDVWSCIVCDGDVDPEWVESLNSVLDDNRLLSLPSGWRVQFGPNVNFIFETHDLSYASPATISRMGIVFLSEEDVSLEDYVNNFLQSQPENIERMLSIYVSDYLFKAIEWVQTEAEVVIQRPKLALVKTTLSQLRDTSSKAQFVVGVLNGLGGQIDESFRENFAQQLFDITGESSPSILSKARYNKDRDLIDSYFTNPNIQIQSANNEMPLVPTADINQTMDVIKIWLQPGKEEHFVIVGPHGSAKTLILEALVKERSDSEIGTIHCSAHITPDYVIHKILQFCIAVSSNKGRIYKPKRGHLALYFKNLHLLKGDKWGTNMLIAFLQQLIVYGGFFDKSLEWVRIENVTIVGSMTPNNQLTTRFTSIVNIYNVNLPQPEDTSIIYVGYLTSILKQCMPNNTSWSKPRITKLVNTILTIFNEVKQTFTQIDQQHYVFSPHDLTKWCRGVLRYKLHTNDTETFLLDVICHEAMRIFGDRLVSEEDKDKFKNIITTIMQNDWSKPNILANIIDNYYVASSQFTSNRSYVPLTRLNAEDWTTIVKKGINQYEREGQCLDIQIIPEILYLAANLSKALTTSEGNCLLAGTSGVGRRSALRIISALETAKLIIPISSNELHFKSDLKTALQYAGVDGDQVYFLIEDHVLNQDYVLNIVNIFLSSGEIPGLYNNPELESLIAGLKDEASRQNFDGNLYDFFVERAKNKLHIIVCLEKDNDKFWKIIENCPALIQKCSMVWMNGWRKESIQSIPKLLVKKANEKLDANKIDTAFGFENIHNEIQSRLASPIRFVNLINTYIEIYVEKKGNIIDRQKKLEAGVSKLTEARNVVADLKVKAANQQEKLAEKQEKANKALDMISNTMKNANVHKEEMETLKKHTEQENIVLVKRKKEIEEELSEVEPLIQEARQAVGNIKTESLSEIRSLRAPPEIIRDILEGVLRLMGIHDTSWNSMKTFLAKRGVKEDIRAFNAGKITPESRHAVEKLIGNKPDSFDPKSAKRASVAAAPLAAWVLANVRYSKVVEKIRPLEKEQNRLQENLSEAEAQLSELSAGLLDVDATVAKLKNQLSTYTREAAELEIQLNAAQETLASAEGLVGKLIDEYERWQSQLKELEHDLENLPSFCLLAASFISYLSGESEDVRINTLNEWIKTVLNDGKFSLEEFLSSEREQLQWQSEGLATDQLSIQNAIIILKTKLCPFLIDPTSMAINWIKKRLQNKNLECTTQDSSKFNTSLELAVRFGKTLLIEEVESVPPVLLAILRKQYTYQGERVLINLNGKLVDYHKDFRLLLTSRNAHLHLPADIVAILSVVNFTTTRAGLTEQLLISAIRQESPHLEERRKELLRQREELQDKQHNLQNQLLEDLANSTGDILQNKNLLTSLNETKASSSAIAQALIESSQIQAKLRQEYEVYRDLSTFGSALYFAAAEFAKSNVIYALSVSSYTILFLKSLPNVQELENTENYIHKVLIQSLYQYMGRGIFKEDRLKFLMHVIHKMFPDLVPENEWNFMIGNVITNRSESTFDKNSIAWIPEHCKLNVISLQSALPDFANTLQLTDGSIWKTFMESNNCETNFPKQCKLSEFQKVIIAQMLRSDRLYSAMSQCVLHLTGIKSLNLDVMHLALINKETNNRQPILLITTSGNDPSSEIRDLANNVVNSDKYIEVSMGEGQETKALQSLTEAAQLGHWLILKNLHLVTTWLPILCQHLQTIKAHNNFRLWLVSETHSNFSSVLAENSLKIAYEAPVGIKSNLYRIYTTYGSDFVQKLNTNSARIFFVLSCVHVVFQERRNYIPQGWSKWYEFSSVDLSAMIQLAEELWQTQNTQMQWKYLTGWSADAIYGGRIENLQDLCILRAYLKQYFSDEVLSHRWKPLSLNNPLPSTVNYQDYLDTILQLNNKDIPLYFGLPENVDRAWEKNASNDVIQYLKNFLISKNVDNKMNRESWQRGLAPYMILWKKLNQGCDFVRMVVPAFDSTNRAPLDTFIREEYRNAVILVQRIHKHFSSLNRIAKGHIISEESDYVVANSLLCLKTPGAWLKLWKGPDEPSKYLIELMNKTVNISKWNNEATVYYRKPINLSLVFNPETLLAAFKQEHARKKNVPIDQLILKTVWKENENALILTGLLMEGSLFDGINLSKCNANTDTINGIPDCYITWEQKTSYVENDKLMSIPLYYTSSREKQLTSIQVPCNPKEINNWIQAGLATFLSY